MSKEREFIFSLEAKNIQGILQKGNFYLIADNGKLTRDNITFVKEKWIQSVLDASCVGINIENCMVTSIFELDI